MALAILAAPCLREWLKSLIPKTKPRWTPQSKPLPGTTLGEEKRGDLSGVFVHKFKLNKQETLLAYRLQPDKLAPEALVSLAVVPHQNCYAQLKR